VTAYTYAIDRGPLPRVGEPLGEWKVFQRPTGDEAEVGPWLLGGTALCELLADHPDRDTYAWRARVWHGHTAAGKPAVTVDWEEVKDAAYAWQKTL